MPEVTGRCGALGALRMRPVRGNLHRTGATGHPIAHTVSDLLSCRKGFRNRDTVDGRQSMTGHGR